MKDGGPTMEFEQTRLITRYKENYKMVERAPITYEMIMHHWDLERRLRDELLSSDAAGRAEVYVRCYTELYKQLPWLNEFSDSGATVPDWVRYAIWVAAIGPAPHKIFEIGAGQGRMLRYLASLGHECTGSDVTSQRAAATLGQENETLKSVIDNAVSVVSVKDAEYDRVLSDQVIEHLHPKDIGTHFETVRRLLRAGGRYLVCCPHIYSGPADVSRVFECGEAGGLHLKEYTWREVIDVAKSAGFDIVYCPMPARLSRLLKTIGMWSERSEASVGRIILTLMCAGESFLSHFRNIRRRRRMSSILLRLGLFRRNCFLVAQVDKVAK
jgi:cyclopropane fatty-acyl-phospholipid synthase-like methyltransferase